MRIDLTIKLLELYPVFLKNLIRQKSVIFSCFILPLVIIYSTWWVTADIPMVFGLKESNKIINASMIDVHVFTGGLTAMAITAGLFSFIMTAENTKLYDRLKLVGYSSPTIILASFLGLFIILFITAMVSILLSLSLAEAKNPIGTAIAIFLVTLNYAAVGNLIGTIYPKITEGTLLILIFSFMDLMLFTNPMGIELYLQTWTLYLPGFWSVQIALESGFIGFPVEFLKSLFLSVLYFLVLILTTQILKSDFGTSLGYKVRRLVSFG
ncbi:MAG: hypothetical protein HeimC2_37520 [Candidatus Heimdallarchaeota archaeon LC_2]|nr:MAG: hypothetical protein HeimC2_37520 [Candidatus Heimdallarchaeota archaeon LC_2]